MPGITIPDDHPPSSRAFWIGIVLGVPIIALGIRGAFAHATDARPPELARWIAGSAILHDAVILPGVATAGLVGRRLVAAWAWPALRWALATTAILLVVSRPFVARYGTSSANPTALPRNYGAGVAVAIGLVWLAATGWAAMLRHHQHRGAG